MEKEFNDDMERELNKIARKKVLKLKSFYTHLVIYAIGVLLFVLKFYFNAPLNFFPLRYLNGFVMIFWTTTVLVSAVDIFASFKIFGQEWEERKMKSLLEKKTEKQKWE